jgi:hypothetical protein
MLTGIGFFVLYAAFDQINNLSPKEHPAR